MTAVILGSGIVFLDGTIVNVALPRMGRELPATLVGVLEGQAYITSGYLAVLAALLIISGALADRYGRRRIFAIGLASFGIVSALCGLAPTMETEIFFRLLQGAAGALLVPGSLSLITANFEGAARGRAFGVWAASTSALTVLGPLVGGALVDLLSWRVAFLLNVPLVLVALYATLRHVPESRDEEAAARLDWLGSIVIAVAVGGIAFGLIRGQEQQWNDPLAFAALGIGLVAAVIFPILMVKSPNPLIPPNLFRSRNFTVINISTFLIYGALYVTQSFQSLFLQGVLGYTAIAASAVGLPTGIMLSLGSTRVGTIAGRLGPRRFLIIGPVFMALGLLWYVHVPATSYPWVIQPGVASSWVPPVSTLVDILPGIAAVRHRDHPGGRPADDGPHELRADAARGPGLGHQQLGVPGRAAAADGRAVHRHFRKLLQRDRRRSRAGRLLCRRAAAGPAAQPATGRASAPPARRDRQRLHGRVPPGDAGQRGPVAGRRRRQRVRTAPCEGGRAGAGHRPAGAGAGGAGVTRRGYARLRTANRRGSMRAPDRTPPPSGAGHRHGTDCVRRNGRVLRHGKGHIDVCRTARRDTVGPEHQVVGAWAAVARHAAGRVGRLTALVRDVDDRLDAGVRGHGRPRDLCRKRAGMADGQPCEQEEPDDAHGHAEQHGAVHLRGAG